MADLNNYIDYVNAKASALKNKKPGKTFDDKSIEKLMGTGGTL